MHFTAGEFFFGAPDWNILDAPLPLPGKALEGRYNEFVEATDKIQDAVLQRRPWGELWPLREMFKDVSAEANHTVDKWVVPLIHRAMNAKAKRGNDEKEPEEGSFLDHMVHSTNDVRFIRDEVLFPAILAASMLDLWFALTAGQYSICSTRLGAQSVHLVLFNTMLSRTTDDIHAHLLVLPPVPASRSTFETPLGDSRCRAGRAA